MSHCFCGDEMFKFLSPIVIIVILFAIILEGTYNQAEVVESTLQLSPTSTSLPLLVEQSLVGIAGVQTVRFSAEENSLWITYDKSRVSIIELEHILTALGYKLIPTQTADISY